MPTTATISKISEYCQCITLKSAAIIANAILSRRKIWVFCFVINGLGYCNTKIERKIKGLSVFQESK